MAAITSSSSSSPEVARLTALLQKAADAIRVERAKYEQLLSENAAQRDRIAGLEQSLRDANAAVAAAQQQSMYAQQSAAHISLAPSSGAPSVADARLRHEVEQLRADNRLLGMESSIAAGQIAQLREENARLRSEAATIASYSQHQLQIQQQQHASTSAEERGGGMRSASAGGLGSSRPQPRSASSAPVPAAAGGWAAEGSPARRDGAGGERPHSSELFARLKARSKGHAAAAAVLHANTSGNGAADVGPLHPGGSHPPATYAWQPSRNRSASAGAPPPPPQQQTNNPSSSYSYGYDRKEQALNRLRRSMAPPPTKEQLDEVIKAMVAEMQSQLGRKGLRLPMRRVKECCYESGKRRFNLSVDSNRLMVKCGGGNVDFLEYVDRHRLCESM